MTINEVKEKNLLAYEYVRGSQLYNTALPPVNGIEQSDTDYGGVYIAPTEMLLGLSENYEPQVSDDKNDITYYELGRWVELLMKANPNALESLFVPEDKIVGKVHPAIQLIIDNRDLFVTKEGFKSLTGYAVSQIKKCRGLNKKCVQPVLERKDVLDFCYTFKNQGSQSMKEFLEERGLDQKYCGLVNIPNMKDTYGVYYDFAAHAKFENMNFPAKREMALYVMEIFGENYYKDSYLKRIQDKTFFGYSGIVHPDGKSNEVRLSSIPKGEEPICFMTYNQNGYESHCRKYKEYQEWVEKRNPIRYESNLKSNYDCKNVMHCVRLLHMGKELAEGQGFNVVRTWDRQMLLDIRNHKYEYEEIIDYIENLFEDMKQKIETCPLPDTVDKAKVNELLIKARKLV
jgi:predicted nucleotidyltransferase